MMKKMNIVAVKRLKPAYMNDEKTTSNVNTHRPKSKISRFLSTVLTVGLSGSSGLTANYS